MKEMLKNVSILIVVAVVAGGAGYYYAPSKVKIEEKIIEKEKEVNLKEKEVIEKYDPVTGKLVSRIIRDKEKNTKNKEDKSEKIIEKSKDQKHYALKFGLAQAFTKADKPVYRVGGEIRLPFFNSWLGAETDIELDKPKLGIYGRMEF